MSQIPYNSNVTVTFTSIEDAVSALCRATFGADMSLDLGEAEPPSPGPVPICVGPPIISILAKEGQWTSAEGHGTLIAADGLFRKDPYEELAKWEAACRAKDGDIDKLHSVVGLQEATIRRLKSEQVVNTWHAPEDIRVPALVAKLDRIEKATMKLRGYREINSHDPAKCIEDAGKAIQDKDATIRRLKEKLSVTAEVMQDNIDLKAECERLLAKWHAAEELARSIEDARAKIKSSLNCYHQFTADVAKALGWGTTEIVLSEVVNEVQHLRRWKNEQMTVISWWEGIDNFVRRHPDAILGRGVADTALAWLKERDALKAELLNVREAWDKDHKEMKRRLDAATKPVTPVAPAEPQYRELQSGEVILPEDEWQSSEGNWEKRSSVIRGEVLCLYANGGFHTPHRRKL